MMLPLNDVAMDIHQTPSPTQLDGMVTLCS